MRKTKYPKFGYCLWRETEIPDKACSLALWLIPCNESLQNFSPWLSIQQNSFVNFEKNIRIYEKRTVLFSSPFFFAFMEVWILSSTMCFEAGLWGDPSLESMTHWNSLIQDLDPRVLHPPVFANGVFVRHLPQISVEM